jgi:hypothetical protein
MTCALPNHVGRALSAHRGMECVSYAEEPKSPSKGPQTSGAEIRPGGNPPLPKSPLRNPSLQPQRTRTSGASPGGNPPLPKSPLWNPHLRNGNPPQRIPTLPPRAPARGLATPEPLTGVRQRPETSPRKREFLGHMPSPDPHRTHTPQPRKRQNPKQGQNKPNRQAAKLNDETKAEPTEAKRQRPIRRRSRSRNPPHRRPTPAPRASLRSSRAGRKTAEKTTTTPERDEGRIRPHRRER